eukprot:TRINITY_DN1572_c0_g1_i5.p1 TRINITY_DN1572_c0_g1~~TRINITY_DN1572_c0_g1_i5.p1  ORF type:complete len:439 (+),score=57.32 TRINITY_DN1572_c0_g1_i5:64-1380(+)
MARKVGAGASSKKGASSPRERSSSSEDESTCAPSSRMSRSSSAEFSVKEEPVAPVKYDPNLWYIHGNTYDLHEFLDKHPGGRMALLTGRGRDCTHLFESYHPWNDKHRKVLRAYGAAPPPPDPFYEEIKAGVRAAFPGGCGTTKMRKLTMLGLATAWCIMTWLFFIVATPLSCALAGCLVATVGTRLSHEGGHWQMSRREWVNRLACFLGFFCVGPSMCWYYQHVISHHVDTNQDGDAEHDVDIEYIWLADKLPGWMKVLSLPGIFVGSVVEIGIKRLIVDIMIRGHVGGHKVDYRLGGLLLEVPTWLFVHYLLGPSLLCYLCMYFTAGAIFVPCSQVAHVILYPDSGKHESWARMQIAESVDFASESDFWYHMAFGLTTQVEHHLFPGIGHHCYDKIRRITRGVCQKHGVHHADVSASKAFGALWTRLVAGTPFPVG